MKGVKVSDLAKAVFTTMPGVVQGISRSGRKGIIERESTRVIGVIPMFLTEDGYSKIREYKRINKYFETVFEI